MPIKKELKKKEEKEKEKKVISASKPKKPKALPRKTKSPRLPAASLGFAERRAPRGERREASSVAAKLKEEKAPKLVKEKKVKVKPEAEKKPEIKPKVVVAAPLSTKPAPTKTVVKEEIKVVKEVKEIKEAPVKQVAPEPVTKGLKDIKIDIPLTVKDLAVKLQIKPNEVIKKLLSKKIIANINQSLDEETARLIALEFGYNLEKVQSLEEALVTEYEKQLDPKKLKPRAPIVTFMGHVDHGKTSLLDMIRKTKVADKEAGGITQHIGAYEVQLPNGKVTFLDTPGHAAFTAMRARGANVTDVVVLVVAADDGVMPQTLEAIDHARAAGVPIVVAINKIDKQNISLDKVKKQLAEVDLLSEDWGGKTITVGVSAKTGQGIDQLLEMLLLEAELLELKANPEHLASGVVVEAELSKGKGPVATVLVLNGILKVGDNVIVGLNYGKIKAMFDDKGRDVKEAGPSKPAEILGLSGVPLAGEKFYVVDDERKLKAIIDKRRLEAEKKKLEARPQKISLEDLYAKIKGGEVKELKIVLKTDVQGSLEALKGSLEKLSTPEVKLSVIHAQVGNINESDIVLGSASNAVILGFHVDITPEAKALSKQEGVDVRLYSIIYEAVNDVKAAMEGMLEPILEEVFIGRAEIKQVFKITKIGIIAGSFVSKGKIPRNASCRLLRDKEVIFKGKISSLRHVKDDIKEAKEGMECGIGIGFSDIKEGDIIEAIEIRKVARRLE